jgi:lysophospholipase L1-like esterase
MKVNSRFWLLAAALLTPVPGFIAPGLTAAEAPMPKPEPRFEIPAADDGLPGAGPIRRYDWFRSLWQSRRAAWARQVAADQGAVVFLGDSITQGWGDNMGDAFPGVKVANRGISGDTTRGVLIRLVDDVLALHPRAVVVLIGTNDLEEGADPEIIAGNLKLILAALETSDTNLPIILCEVFPSAETKQRPAAKIKRVNQLYAQTVKGDARVILLQTWLLFANAQGDAKPEEFPDLLHPNNAGYARWAAALRRRWMTSSRNRASPGCSTAATWRAGVIARAPRGTSRRRSAGRAAIQTRRHGPS